MLLEGLSPSEDLVGDPLRLQLVDEVVQILEVVAEDRARVDVPDLLDGLQDLSRLLVLVVRRLYDDVPRVVAPGLQLQVVAVGEPESVHVVRDGLSAPVGDGERLHLVARMP